MNFQFFSKSLQSSQRSNEWLYEQQINPKKIPVGYQSGVLHKGKTKQQLQELESLGLIHSPDSASRYQSFAKGSVLFPIRDKYDNIANYFSIDPKTSETQYLNEETGYYPNYPKPSTKQLVLTYDLIESAKLCSTPLAEDLSVTHLTSGSFENHHRHLLENLPYLQEIVVPGILKRDQLNIIQESILELRPDVTLIYSGEPSDFISEVLPLERISDHLYRAENEFFCAEIIGTTLHPDSEVTLKISKCGDRRNFRDTLNLYNNTMRQFFIEEAMRYLMIDDKELLESFLDDLTDSVEQFARSTGKSHVRANEIQITDSDRETGLSYLTKTNLSEIVHAELLNEIGIVGEAENRSIVWLAMISRKLRNPLHVVCYGDSGTGKSQLQESVSQCFDETEFIELTSSSDKALYYLGNALENKVLLIQDLFDLNDEVMYQLRELMSKKKLTRTVTIKDKDQGFLTEVKTMKASVSVIACTTENAIYHDNANRSIELRIDSSDQQDQQILRRQKMMAAHTLDFRKETKARNLLQIMDRLILPYDVINPYAMELDIPKSIFSKRRTMNIYLGLIEAVCLLNQYQRKRTTQNSQEFLIVDLKDIEFANKIMPSILIQKSDSLNQGQREFMESLKTYVSKNQGIQFTQKMLVQSLRLHPSKVKRYIKQLTSFGYISIVGGDKYRKGYQYTLADTNDYQKLKQEVETILSQNLARAKKIKITDQ